jgi:hypothetical protein
MYQQFSCPTIASTLSQSFYYQLSCSSLQVSAAILAHCLYQRSSRPTIESTLSPVFVVAAIMLLSIGISSYRVPMFVAAILSSYYWINPIPVCVLSLSSYHVSFYRYQPCYPGPLFVSAAILSYCLTNPIPAVFVIAAKICQLSCSPPSAILYHCLHHQPESPRGMWRLNVAASCLIKQGGPVCLHLQRVHFRHTSSVTVLESRKGKKLLFSPLLKSLKSASRYHLFETLSPTFDNSLLIKVPILASSLRIIAKDNAQPYRR